MRGRSAALVAAEEADAVADRLDEPLELLLEGLRLDLEIAAEDVEHASSPQTSRGTRETASMRTLMPLNWLSWPK